MPFSTLLYRYFFYGWLFRDVNRGTLWERAAAWRHNREQAHWLPTYMKRWTVCGLLLIGLACFCENVLGCRVLSAFFYVPGALAMPYNAVTAVCWGALVSSWGEQR